MAKLHNHTDNCPICADLQRQLDSARTALSAAFDAWCSASVEPHSYAFQSALEEALLQILSVVPPVARAQEFKTVLQRLRRDFPAYCADWDEQARQRAKAN